MSLLGKYNIEETKKTILIKACKIKWMSLTNILNVDATNAIAFVKISA